MLSSKQKIIATAKAKGYDCSPEWWWTLRKWHVWLSGYLDGKSLRFNVGGSDYDEVIRKINELPDADSQ